MKSEAVLIFGAVVASLSFLMYAVASASFLSRIRVKRLKRQLHDVSDHLFSSLSADSAKLEKLKLQLGTEIEAIGKNHKRASELLFAHDLLFKAQTLSTMCLSLSKHQACQARFQDLPSTLPAELR